MAVACPREPSRRAPSSCVAAVSFASLDRSGVGGLGVEPAGTRSGVADEFEQCCAKSSQLVLADARDGAQRRGGVGAVPRDVAQHAVVQDHVGGNTVGGGRLAPPRLESFEQGARRPRPARPPRRPRGAPAAPRRRRPSPGAAARARCRAAPGARRRSAAACRSLRCRRRPSPARPAAERCCATAPRRRRARGRRPPAARGRGCALSHWRCRAGCRSGTRRRNAVAVR